MVGKAQYTSPPSGVANGWLREALDAAGKSHVWLADELNRLDLGMTYSRSTIGEMTRKRKITAEEAAAISLLTGMPLPYPGADPVQQVLAIFRQVPVEHQAPLLAKMVNEVFGNQELFVKPGPPLPRSANS